MDEYQQTAAACAFTHQHTGTIRPQVGGFCGRGLGNIVDLIANQIVISYSKIPGSPFAQIALPIRVIKMLGAEYLFVTNAAGGKNRAYKPGDMMVIQDHVDFSSLVGLNPLTGPNDERFGPRFPALAGMYDAELRELAHHFEHELGLQEDTIHEGIYFHTAGPAYETSAVGRILGSLGCNAVGMSTTQETIVARHLNMKIFAISLITDTTHVPKKSPIAVLTHAEVLQVANERAPVLARLLEKMLTCL